MNMIPGGDGEASNGRYRHSPRADAGGVQAFLYDADGQDKAVPFDASIKRELLEQDLLWVDLNMPDQQALARLDSCFGTAMLSFAGSSSPARPRYVTTASTSSCECCRCPYVRGARRRRRLPAPSA